MVLVAIKNLLFNSNSGKTKSPLLEGDRRLNYRTSFDNDAVSTRSRESYTPSMLSFEAASNPRVISDAIIGLSDGLTVPFALTAGLSLLGSSHLVITGGVAELVSGAISMGLGGYLAAKSESEHYAVMIEKEKLNHREEPDAFAIGVHEALNEYHLSDEAIKLVVRDLAKSQRKVAHFMVKMVHGIEEPATGRELTSALTIGLSYFLGGFVPLIPYFFTKTVHMGLIISIILMAITLFVFGYVKTVLSLGSDSSQSSRFWNGLSMLVTGGAAAGSAWVIVSLIDGSQSK